MIRDVMKDHMFLQCKSQIATKEDVHIAYDLLETLQFHKARCVGMAANMIGIHKQIIAFYDETLKAYSIMLNPEIMKTSGSAYKTQEGCLSLEGERETKRYSKIKVRYHDENMKVKIKSYEGFTAQIIQHEIDHCNGILI